MFEDAERIADAVLYEGYVLYPYRASAAKNRFRWQFGVLAPRSPGEDGEPWFSQTECIVATPCARAPDASLGFHVRVRGLRPEPNDDGWLQGVPVVCDASFDLASPALDRVLPLAETALDVRLSVSATPSDGLTKLRLRLENHEAWSPEFVSDRDAMLRRSLAAVHLLLAVEGGGFVSLLEPPAAAAALAASCQNRHTWPVLVGSRVERRLMLSSPIVLYDYPAVARESGGDLCDAAEIDEILSLRILTMTDEEKCEARATDPRARAILDRIESLSPDELSALHGTMRSADFFNPPGASSDEAFVVVHGRRIVRGSSVRLRPCRRSDAMDMFFDGQQATVAGVHRDVDDRVYIAVTIDADPAAALHDSFGRYFYFDPAEVEPTDNEEHV